MPPLLRAFSPDDVCGYRCDQCQAQSSSDRPATRQRLLLSLPRFLRINITASLTSEALPVDFHRHGPLREYETLDLSQLTPQPLCKRAHYTLRAAIMYSARHHWTYLHGPTPIYVSDDTSRIASPQDIQMVALCARILIYEQIFPPGSCLPAPVLCGTAAATATAEAVPAQILSAPPQQGQALVAELACQSTTKQDLATAAVKTLAPQKVALAATGQTPILQQK